MLEHPSRKGDKRGKALGIAEEIRKLAAERKAVILAHNYQPGEIQDLADHTGDSYGLSMIASRSEAEVIVFCGVRFMAESAAILAPGKKVILPSPKAGCPLADTITAEDVRALKEENPGLPVVAYVNTSAEVKAESDCCCTSSNAVTVVEAISLDRVIFIPDRNLADYTARMTGREIISWPGFCPVHERITVEDVEEVRSRHPEALFIVHPECRPAVAALADHVTSTSGFYRYISSSPAKSFIIGTEEGVLYRLERENPGKKFFSPGRKMVCPNMKLATMEDILFSLEGMTNLVEVPQDTADRARASLEKMLLVSD
jgi:quinolinate synthase